MLRASIYHLYELGSDIPAYVGQTRKWKHRKACHISGSAHADYGAKTQWLHELWFRGMEPSMVKVDEVSGRTLSSLNRKALKAERAEIQRVADSGVILLNKRQFFEAIERHCPKLRTTFRSAHDVNRVLQARCRRLMDNLAARCDHSPQEGLLSLLSDYPILDVIHAYRDMSQPQQERYHANAASLLRGYSCQSRNTSQPHQQPSGGGSPANGSPNFSTAD